MASSESGQGHMCLSAPEISGFIAILRAAFYQSEGIAPQRASSHGSAAMKGRRQRKIIRRRTEGIQSDFIKRLTSDYQDSAGAIEGTRTPTPLRVHGPEPCASANSATMAWIRLRQFPPLRQKWVGFGEPQSPPPGKNCIPILQRRRWLSNQRRATLAVKSLRSEI